MRAAGAVHRDCHRSNLRVHCRHVRYQEPPPSQLRTLGRDLLAACDVSTHAAAPADLVTRTSAEGKVYGARQRVSAEEALRAWTLGSAFAAFEEHHTGSIAIGQRADYVVLSADPTLVKPETIRDVGIEETIMGGRTVFRRK